MDKGTFKQWLVNYGSPAFNLYKENIKQEPALQEQLDKDGADFDKVVAESPILFLDLIVNLLLVVTIAVVQRTVKVKSEVINTLGVSP